MGSQEVVFYYLTEFANSIVLSLNIKLYASLKDIAMLYAKTVKDVANQIRSSTNDNKIVQVEEQDEAQKLVFICKRFQLSPTLSFLGESTPSLQSVFKWLGIKDIDRTIPKFTHTGLTQNMETLLKALCEVSLWMERLDKKL